MMILTLTCLCNTVPLQQIAFVKISVTVMIPVKVAMASVVALACFEVQCPNSRHPN